ncbi:MAG: hypothetical protein ACLFU6_08665 [Candidatus Hydrogenedentota bacterium]
MPIKELVRTVFTRLTASWRAWFEWKQAKRLPSGLPYDIAGEERLARFLKHKKQFSATNGIVKYAAFLPSHRDGKTSVFRHTGDPAEELWKIGHRELGDQVTVYGAGIIVAFDTRAAGLGVSASEPPPRHANIEGWPTRDDPELAKAAQREVAKALAERAVLLLRQP